MMLANIDTSIITSLSAGAEQENVPDVPDFKNLI